MTVDCTVNIYMSAEVRWYQSLVRRSTTKSIKAYIEKTSTRHRATQDGLSGARQGEVRAGLTFVHLHLPFSLKSEHGRWYCGLGHSVVCMGV